mgnify:FL=1
MESHKSWIHYEPTNHFPIQNIPFGTFEHPKGIRCCTWIGDHVIDLAWLEAHGLLAENSKQWSILYAEGRKVFDNKYLNDFIDLGKEVWHETWVALQTIFTSDKYQQTVTAALFDHHKVKLTMPVFIRDYTDFYSSYNHAYNVGAMMRPDNPLFPNWKHIPIGYHGRASSVVVSGTDFKRPKG